MPDIDPLAAAGAIHERMAVRPAAIHAGDRLLELSAMGVLTSVWQ